MSVFILLSVLVCVFVFVFYLFFFKQKTAYEMRISDWSSDVCSSDLPFGKIVYGVAGDVVAHRGDLVTINGKAVARMKARTRLGKPLAPGATGAVPAGCYFAATPHRDGFDSRYADIGFVCVRQVLGTGVPILLSGP